MKAVEKWTYLDNNTNKLNILEVTFEIELVDKKNCVKVYKILKDTSQGFVKGEIFHDLKTNQITISQVNTTLYEPKNEFVTTAILNKCGCGWRGPNIYTEGLKGEASILEFKFL